MSTLYVGQLVLLARTVRLNGRIGTVERVIVLNGSRYIRVAVEVGWRRVGPGTHMVVIEILNAIEQKFDPIKES